MIAFSSLINTQYSTELGLAEYLSFSINITGKTNGACLFELSPLDPKSRTGLEQNIGANIKKSNPWSLMVSLEILDELLQTCRASSDFTALVRESSRAGRAIQCWSLRLVESMSDSILELEAVHAIQKRAFIPSQVSIAFSGNLNENAQF